jgi:putative FmdB family regulatory protein
VNKMPTYDYRCEQCGKFQITQGIKEEPLKQCPTCGKPVNRLIGKNVNIILKGSGFYSTDNRNSSSENKAESSESKAS